MINLVRVRDREIQNRDSTANENGTESFEIFSQSVRKSKKNSTAQNSDRGSSCFVNPFFIDREFYKECDTDNKNNYTDKSEQTFTD